MKPSNTIFIVLFPSVISKLVSSIEPFETDSETTKPPSFILSEEIAVILSIASVVV